MANCQVAFQRALSQPFLESTFVLTETYLKNFQGMNGDNSRLYCLCPNKNKNIIRWLLFVNL